MTNANQTHLAQQSVSCRWWRCPGAVVESGRMPAGDQSLELLVGYLRAELDWYLRRIDRADARAAGTITVGIAFVGIVATALLALHRSPPRPALIVMVVGGVLLILGLVFTVSTMDESQEPAAWFTFVFDRWPFVSFYNSVAELVGDRRDTEAKLDLKQTPTMAEDLVTSLECRLAAAKRVALSQEHSVRLAAITTFVGMLMIAASGAFAVSAG